MESGKERRGPIPSVYDKARILSLHTPSELRDFLCHPMHRYSPHIQIDPRTLALTLGQMTDKNNKLIIARPDLKRMGRIP